MAVKQIFNKRIMKVDSRNPNYRPPSERKEEEVSGNVVEEDVYGERKHFINLNQMVIFKWNK